MAKLMVTFAVAALLVACVAASDPSPINDYCPTDFNSTLVSNFLPCKPVATVSDFYFTGFRADAATNNPLGFGFILGFASGSYPGLNTLGLAVAKVNYAKGGVSSPHTHPRASEVITVLKGEVYVGFVDTNGKLFAVTLKESDVFVFPQGLVHFQLNVGEKPAATLAVFNAQNPGVQPMPSSLFGSTPAIRSDVLAKAFGISEKEAISIQKGFQA
jgi:quercetin dioxygenase-like cupin family protein